MRYAGGRPLWHMSVALWPRSGSLPVPLFRWNANAWRKAEAGRSDAGRGLGTDEPWFADDMAGELGARAIAVHWRKPLRIDEVNRLAPTAEVIRRPGRA